MRIVHPATIIVSSSSVVESLMLPAISPPCQKVTKSVATNTDELLVGGVKVFYSTVLDLIAVFCSSQMNAHPLEMGTARMPVPMPTAWGFCVPPGHVKIAYSLWN
jgi:hypothetical protein